MIALGANYKNSFGGVLAHTLFLTLCSGVAPSGAWGSFSIRNRTGIGSMQGKASTIRLVLSLTQNFVCMFKTHLNLFLNSGIPQIVHFFFYLGGGGFICLFVLFVF